MLVFGWVIFEMNFVIIDLLLNKVVLWYLMLICLDLPMKLSIFFLWTGCPTISELAGLVDFPDWSSALASRWLPGLH